MAESGNITRAIDNQKEIIVKLQSILQDKIDIYSSAELDYGSEELDYSCEELEQLASAIQYAAETLNNLAEYDREAK